MKHITRGEWRVANGMSRLLDGFVVITGDNARPVIIADCRRLGISRVEQAANAILVAKAPKMARALLAIEDAVGDLPASNAVAKQIYAVVADALKGIDLERPDGEP
jgi:hypothetical protein